MSLSTIVANSTKLNFLKLSAGLKATGYPSFAISMVSNLLTCKSHYCFIFVVLLVSFMKSELLLYRSSVVILNIDSIGWSGRSAIFSHVLMTTTSSSGTPYRAP
ncbi:hypothetical protein BDQ94DRAFT_135686 [Aspergillus welwitschiae]|uniref:Uncharacterized protein n=1 Tax=Aspergillus welwitschiae TaxID=1341132 RepID=A0A3F3QG49_9EURO|nr:hypothetical protein BDQ94DRAFT_135686 [Aspergillus welwitschiae]RDH38117.1 hypothetical protein BDQ94DRAFT_135686 [Aspergillus welwitschiae]